MSSPRARLWGLLISHLKRFAYFNKWFVYFYKWFAYFYRSPPKIYL